MKFNQALLVNAMMIHHTPCDDRLKHSQAYGVSSVLDSSRLRVAKFGIVVLDCWSLLSQESEGSISSPGAQHCRQIQLC